MVVGIAYMGSRRTRLGAATYDLLPSLARWYGACEANCAAVGDDELVFLAGSIVRRLQRALQDRDRALFSLNRPTIGDADRDALDALDASCCASRARSTLRRELRAPCSDGRVIAASGMD
jgi:hypothetical protein